MLAKRKVLPIDLGFLVGLIFLEQKSNVDKVN